MKPFTLQLAENIRVYIRKARRDGTTGMSAGNLKQCVATPSPSLPGAPQGGNIQWQYANHFNEAIAMLTGKDKSFVIS